MKRVFILAGPFFFIFSLNLTWAAEVSRVKQSINSSTISVRSPSAVTPATGIIQAPETVQDSPLYKKHSQYAQSVFGYQNGESHVLEIAQKWQQHMGNTNPEEINTIIGFNNFHSFVKSVNFKLPLSHGALSGKLSQFPDLIETLRNNLNNPNHEIAQDAAQTIINHIKAMQESALVIRMEMYEAADRYGVPLTFATAVFAEDNPEPVLRNIVEKFGESVASILLAGAPWYLQGYSPSGALTFLLLDCTLKYEKAGGIDGFVSFVNYGPWAFNKWGGEYGGDGAIDAASVKFLSY